MLRAGLSKLAGSRSDRETRDTNVACDMPEMTSATVCDADCYIITVRGCIRGGCFRQLNNLRRGRGLSGMVPALGRILLEAFLR